MSVISYFGGKANFQSFITPKIPKDCKTYIEPFSGSFAIYMDSDLEFENVIFNDRNRHQANLMRCCASPEEFLVEIKALLALYFKFTSLFWGVNIFCDWSLGGFLEERKK